MNIKLKPRLFERLSKYLHTDVGVEYKTVFILICLWAFIYWSLLLYEHGFNDGVLSVAEAYSDVVPTGDGTYFLLYSTMQGRILWCLIGIIIGLYSRRAIGFIASLLCNLAIIGVFYHWHLETLRYISNLELTPERLRDSPQLQSFIQNVGWFYGGTLLDKITFAMAIIFLLWHVIQLIRAYNISGPQLESD